MGTMDPMELLKNLNNLQSQFKDIQEKMKDIHASGSSGGGMVKIDMNGAMEIEKISIAPEIVDPDDVSMLQDLILAAFNSAMQNVKEKMQSEAAGMTGGMAGGMPGFPGGFPSS